MRPSAAWHVEYASIWAHVIFSITLYVTINAFSFYTRKNFFGKVSKPEDQG